jgi:hypothetical protein
MNPIKFPQVNVTYAENQPEYFPIPVWKRPDDPEGQIIICWKFTWRERLAILFNGILWHHVLTFNKQLQPMALGTDNPFQE